MSMTATGGMMAAGIVSDITDWLDDISANWWFLAVILAIAILDSVVPVVPSETTVIIGGVAASSAGGADYPLWAVIACGAAGAFIGDNMSYLIGRRAAGWFERRGAKKPKTQQRLDWAAEQIRVRGGLLLITARFIPGGRTALTLSSGITRQPRGWFAGWVAVAAVIWATYAASLGYFGGEVFKDDHTTAFLVAFGTALSVTVVIEIVRHLITRRRVEQAMDAPPPDTL
jgi:membrane protein DedA with SNARE-associated domain